MQLKSVVTFHAGKTIKIPQPQQSLTVSDILAVTDLSGILRSCERNSDRAFEIKIRCMWLRLLIKWCPKSFTA